MDYSKGLKVVLGVFIAMAVLVGVLNYFSAPKIFFEKLYTHYNNYIIFKASYGHLIHHQNLYEFYEAEYGDLYKYSPTFAMLMAPFYVLPDVIGLVFWNLLNCLFLYFGIKSLPQISERVKFLALSFSVIELLTSVQNSQSNALIAGMLIMAFALMERKQIFLATLLIMLSFYIKITGILACVFFFLYDDKIKFAGWSLFWFVLLGALPLLVVSPDQLIWQYQNWGVLLANDHSASAGISIFGIIQSWTHLDIPKNLILGVGAVLFLVPLIKVDRYSEFTFRLNYLCLLLIWIIIFNHKGESPAYIIAFAGCALWYFTSPATKFNTALFALCVLLISLSPTDLFPKFIRTAYVVPLSLKALPAVICWMVIEWRMVFK